MLKIYIFQQFHVKGKDFSVIISRFSVSSESEEPLVAIPSEPLVAIPSESLVAIPFEPLVAIPSEPLVAIPWAIRCLSRPSVSPTAEKCFSSWPG